MAEIRKFTADEAMSAEQAGKWYVPTTTKPLVATTVYDFDVSDYHTVIIDCTGTIDILFDTLQTGEPNDSNDLKIPAGITSIKVPHGLGDTVWFHMRGNSTTTPTVRLVFT
jgi:hypothetical protein